MSPPPPWIDHAPLASVCVPDGVAPPMSPQAQPLGQVLRTPIVTVSNDTSLTFAGLCEVTAKPANTLPARAGMVIDESGIAVQLMPSLDVYPVKVVPARATMRYMGAVPVVAIVLVTPPCVVRYWTTIPLLGVTNAA